MAVTRTKAPGTSRPAIKTVRLAGVVWLLAMVSLPRLASSAPTPQRTAGRDFESETNGLSSQLRYGVAGTDPPDINPTLDSQPDAFHSDERRQPRYHPTIHIIDNGGSFVSTSPMPAEEEDEEEENSIFSIVIQEDYKNEQSAYIAPDVDWLRELASRVAEVSNESEGNIKDAVFQAMAEDDHQIYVNVVKSSVETSDQVPVVMEKLKDLFETGGAAARQHYRSSQPNKQGLVLNVVIFNVLADQGNIPTSLQPPDVKITPSQGPVDPNEKDSYIEAFEESRKPLSQKVTNLGRDGLKDAEQNEGVSVEDVKNEEQISVINDNSPRGPFFVGRNLGYEIEPWTVPQRSRMELDYLTPEQISNNHEEIEDEQEEDDENDEDASVPSSILYANLADTVVIEADVPTTTTVAPPSPIPSTTQPSRVNSLRTRFQQMGFVGVPLLAGLGALSMILPTVGRKKRAILLQQVRLPEYSDDRVALPKAIEDRDVLALLMGARYKNLTKTALQHSIDTWKDRDKDALNGKPPSGSLSSTNRPIWVTRPITPTLKLTPETTTTVKRSTDSIWTTFQPSTSETLIEKLPPGSSTNPPVWVTRPFAPTAKTTTEAKTTVKRSTDSVRTTFQPSTFETPLVKEDVTRKQQLGLFGGTNRPVWMTRPFTPTLKTTTEAKTTVKRSTDSVRTTFPTYEPSYEPFEGREDIDDEEDAETRSSSSSLVTPVVPPLNEDYDLVQSFFTATIEKLANDDGKNGGFGVKGPVIVTTPNTEPPTKTPQLSTLSVFSSEPVMPQNSPATNSPVTFVSDSRPSSNFRPRPSLNRFPGSNNRRRPTTSTTSSTSTTAQTEPSNEEDNNIVQTQLNFETNRPVYVYQTTPEPEEDVPVMTLPANEPVVNKPYLPSQFVINPFEVPVRPTVRPSISLLTMHRNVTDPPATKQTTKPTTTTFSSSAKPSSTSPTSTSTWSSTWSLNDPSTWPSEPSTWSSTSQPLYTWSSTNDPSYTWTLNSQTSSSSNSPPSTATWTSSSSNSPSPSTTWTSSSSNAPPSSTTWTSSSSTSSIGPSTRRPVASRRPVANNRPAFVRPRPATRPSGLLTIQNFQSSSLPPPVDVASGTTSPVAPVRFTHNGIVTSEPYDYYSTVSNGGSALVSDVINEQNFISGLIKGATDARPVISPSGLHSGVGTAAPNRVTGAPQPILGTNVPNYVIAGTNPPVKLSGTNPPSHYGEPPASISGTNAPWLYPVKVVTTTTTSTTTPATSEEEQEYSYTDSASILSLKNTTKLYQIDASGSSYYSTPFPTVDLSTVLSQLNVTASPGGPYFVNSSTDIVLIHPMEVTPPSTFDLNELIPGKPYNKPYKPLPIVEAIVAEEASAIPVDPELFVNNAFPLDQSELDNNGAINIDAIIDDTKPDSVPVVSNNANLFLVSSGSSGSSSSGSSSVSVSSDSSSSSISTLGTSISLSNVGSLAVLGATAVAATAIALAISVPFGFGKKRRSYKPARKKHTYPAAQHPAKVKQSFGEPPPDYYYEDDETTAYKKKQSFAEPPPNYYREHPEYTADYDIVERSVPSSKEDSQLDTYFSDPGQIQSEDLYGPATVFLKAKR